MESFRRSHQNQDKSRRCASMLPVDHLQNPAVRRLSVGFSNNYKTIYVPFGDTWVAGKRHIYTLIFGGGYTDQGEAVLNRSSLMQRQQAGLMQIKQIRRKRPTLIQTFINIVPVGRLNIRKINPANGFFRESHFQYTFDV